MLCVQNLFFLNRPGALVNITKKTCTLSIENILTLAEMRRGIELKGDTKARFALERVFDFVLEDYREAIYVFDEAAAAEWGRMMAEFKNRPIPYDDSLIGAIARSCGLTVVTRNEKHFPGCKTVNPWRAEVSP